jgi:hypothetical protein
VHVPAKPTEIKQNFFSLYWAYQNVDGSQADKKKKIPE